MTVAVADERRAVPQPAPGKIRQPAETTPADRRAPSPSDSGSDTTEAGDAANPIQRTPDAVAMAKDGASAPASAASAAGSEWTSSPGCLGVQRARGSLVDHGDAWEIRSSSLAW